MVVMVVPPMVMMSPVAMVIMAVVVVMMVVAVMTALGLGLVHRQPAEAKSQNGG